MTASLEELEAKYQEAISRGRRATYERSFVQHQLRQVLPPEQYAQVEELVKLQAAQDFEVAYTLDVKRRLDDLRQSKIKRIINIFK